MIPGLPASFSFLIATLVLVGCRGPESLSEPIRPVRAITVGDLKAMSGREFPGRAAAKNTVDLSFQVAGPLVLLPVDVGSTVKKGDLIAALDPRDFETSVASADGSLERAKANLLAMEHGARPEEIEQIKAVIAQTKASYDQAVAEHQRSVKLIEANAISQREFDISKARLERATAEVDAAEEELKIGLSGARPEDLDAKRSEIRALEATLTAAKNQLEYATLTAPFDGEVAARYVDNFQTVQAKQPIVRLLDVSAIEVTIQIPESLIGLVPQVKQVGCRFDAIPDREFVGKITKIGREASQTTRTYPVTIEIEHPEDTDILPGMAAMVHNLPVEDQPGAAKNLIVPPSSVFTTADDQQAYVWVVDDGSKKVSRRAVKIGGLTPVGLSVIEGLAVGDIVVTAGVNTLREGQLVRLL